MSPWLAREAGAPRHWGLRLLEEVGPSTAPMYLSTLAPSTYLGYIFALVTES